VCQEISYLWRTSLYLAASASAEFFADILLCPMEALKVRIQTQPGWANNFREGFPKLLAEEGLWGYVIFFGGGIYRQGNIACRSALWCSVFCTTLALQLRIVSFQRRVPFQGIFVDTFI